MKIIEKDTADGLRFKQQIEDLVKLKLKAGFLEGAVYDDGNSVADIAAFNEFGSSTTPARPFLSNSVDLHKDELDKYTDDLFDQLCNGSIDAEEYMQRLGEFQKGLIQGEIENGTYAPNALSTIKKKGSNHPLIDTGHMKDSVGFNVEEE